MVIGQSEKMEKDIKSRIAKGFFLAWVASVVVAFLTGCIHSIHMESGHVAEFLKGVISGNRDALTAFFLVGFVAAMGAALISVLATIFIAWPLYLASRRHGVFSLSAYLLAGLIVSLVVVGILLVTQRYLNPLLPSDYVLEVISILIAGPVAAMSLWMVVRPDRYK